MPPDIPFGVWGKTDSLERCELPCRATNMNTTRVSDVSCLVPNGPVRSWQYRCGILACELWPNLMTRCQQRGIRVTLSREFRCGGGTNMNEQRTNGSYSEYRWRWAFRCCLAVLLLEQVLASSSEILEQQG